MGHLSGILGQSTEHSLIVKGVDTVRSPQLCGERSPQSFLVVLTFPLAKPGASPLGAWRETQNKTRD